MPTDAAAEKCFAPDINVNRSVLDNGKSRAVNKNLKGVFCLRKASDFVLLIEQAKAYRAGDFLIRYLDNQRGHARLGIAISKKRVKHAVHRNRIRRIIRETFRRYCLRLPNKDYMISYRGLQKQDSSVLHKSLICFWEREIAYHSK